MMIGKGIISGANNFGRSAFRIPSPKKAEKSSKIPLTTNSQMRNTVLQPLNQHLVYQQTGAATFHQQTTHYGQSPFKSNQSQQQHQQSSFFTSHAAPIPLPASLLPLLFKHATPSQINQSHGNTLQQQQLPRYVSPSIIIRNFPEAPKSNAVNEVQSSMLKESLQS